MWGYGSLLCSSCFWVEGNHVQAEVWFIKNLLFCHSNCWLSACLSFSLPLSFLKLKWLIREMPSGVPWIGYADLCAAVLNSNAHPIRGEWKFENMRCWILARQIRQLCEQILKNIEISVLNSIMIFFFFFLMFAIGVDSGTKNLFSFKKAQFWHFMLK